MQEGSIQRLVAIFPGALGDLMLVLPTLRRLRGRHAAHVTLVVAEPLRALARTTGVAEEVASLDDARSTWLYGGSLLPSWLAGRPAVYAWLGATDRALRERLLPVASAVRLLSVERGAGRVHAAVAYARAAGVAAPRAALEADARLQSAEPAILRTLLGRLRRPLLALHRGAGSPAKRWTPVGFAAVARAWQASGGDVVDVLGPAEAGDEALAGAAVVRDWALPDVAALLGAVDAYLGSDSGISHLAAAAGARGAALFTATDPTRWRPLGRSIVALRARAPMSGVDREAARVLRAVARLESLTSSDLGSSVRA